MGMVKVQNLVRPESSVIEAVGYSVLHNEMRAEVIHVETSFGKIYEYIAYDGDGKNYFNEFNKIAFGESAGRAWHEFKATNRPTTSMEVGNGANWGEFELVLDDADSYVEETADEETEKPKDTVNVEAAMNPDYVRQAIDAPLRQDALAGALAFAQITKRTNLDEVIANASKILAYLKA